MNDADDVKHRDRNPGPENIDLKSDSNSCQVKEKEDSGVSVSDSSTSASHSSYSFNTSFSSSPSPTTAEPPVRDVRFIDKESALWKYLNFCSALSLADNETGEENSGESKTGRRRFFPYSLHKRRHDVALEQLKRHAHLIDVLVDFGCASGEFLQRAIRQLPRIENMVGVDIDQSELSRAYDRVKPDLKDSFDKLDNPLRLQFYKGSVAEFDRRIFNVDAVIGIELIEHVDATTLQLLPWVIFAQLRPFIVILSTPNVEFNVAFDMGDRSFRHDDHKFEWNRLQFQLWCEKITMKFPQYWVKFTGVGEPPAEYPDVGYCTQIAIFRMRRDSYAKLKMEKRQERFDEIQNFGENFDFNQDLVKTDVYDQKPYELMHDIKYPEKLSERKMQLISLECHFQCMKLVQELGKDEIFEDGRWFEFNEILANPKIAKYFRDEAEFGLCLVDQNWIVDFSKMRAFYETDMVQAKPNCGDSTSDEDDSEQDAATTRTSYIVHCPGFTTHSM